MNTIVAKFGGTSVSTGEQIKKVAAIVGKNPARRIVVVSAPGKRSSEDRKITDMLYACHAVARSGGDVGKEFRPIAARYGEIANVLGIGRDFTQVLSEVETRIAAGAGVDEVVSRGEYLCARMVARFLNYEFVDAADLIRFAQSDTVDGEATYRAIAERLDDNGRYVIPGFYGARAAGGIQLFSRGGSDISAALVARGVHAEVYENWTDVSGLLSADPRIVDDPAPIEEVTYGELRELAYLGANVFHEEAVFPVASTGIPINIRNTNRPEDAGTRIVGEVSGHRRSVTGIAGKRGYRALYVEKSRMHKDETFGVKLGDVRDRLNLTVIHTAGGSDSLLMILPEEQVVAKEADLLQALRSELGCEKVESDARIAIIGVVGAAVAEDAAVSGAMLSELSRAKIPIRFVSMGYSRKSFMVGVDDEFYVPAMQALYRASVA